MEMLLRFSIGGVMVLLLSIVGDVARPKSFAGIFGAAPSVALATLAVTVWSHGVSYATTEARSMVIGAVALGVYAWVCGVTMWRRRESVTVLALAAISVWVVLALSGWVLLLRGRS
jgi:hypothetical protein